MKTTKLLICAISVAAAVMAAKANAQNIVATHLGADPGFSVTGTFDNAAGIWNIPSGVMHFDVFDGFCVEPLQPISDNEVLVYQVQNVSQLANSDQISRLVGGYLLSSQTADQAAAVQWAIWEVAAETLSSPSLLDGNVRIIDSEKQSTAVLAGQYLANINNYAPARLTYLTNGTRQNAVVFCVIPEPGAMVLTALSGLLLLRRRR
jgi:hypothetical protein